MWLKSVNISVQMKGKVATSMGTNELMITELVFRNVLTDMQPTEIAALLSGLVFQAKTKEELRPDFLEKVMSSNLLNSINYCKRDS